MPFVDRQIFIELLERLRGEDDADVVAAAREIASRMDEAGLGWEDVLIPEEGEYAEEEEEDAFDQAAAEPAGNPDDDAALIDMMLAKYDLTDATREELLGYKEDIAEGEFTDADSAYLRALKSRLDGR